jgi:hypothetical protein
VAEGVEMEMKKKNTFTEHDVMIYRRAYFGSLEGEPPVTMNDLEKAEALQRRVGSDACDLLHDLLRKNLVP